MAEQEHDLREIDAERAREERRQVLEEAALVADALQCDEPAICSDPVHQTARAIAARIRALIDKEPALDRI